MILIFFECLCPYLMVAYEIASVTQKQRCILKDKHSACEIIAVHYYGLSFYFHGL